MSREAMKLALEALKYPLNQSHENFNVDMAELLAHRAITAIKEALAEQPAQQDSTCSNALRIQHKAYPRTCKKCGLGPCVELAQQALDKKAENARELGLDYEPAQQEPVAYLCENAVGHQYFRWKKPSSTYKPIALYTSPPAQRKPLTDEQQIAEALRVHGLTLVKTASGYEVLKLGQIAAHNIKENT